MRVIAGFHRSRKLQTLEGMNTRPMMDRMKETIFNTIGPYFNGQIVLDLFGGSGALSIEAISRGASKAYIVDSSSEAIQVITQNVKSLKEEDKVQIFKMDYMQALNKFKDLKFDIVFLDPPFRMNITNEIVDFILDNKMLNINGIVVCQCAKGNFEKVNRLNLHKNYAYGKSEAAIYKMD
jgi:16S rRNA (guanine966-N2)-methyltransferase